MAGRGCRSKAALRFAARVAGLSLATTCLLGSNGSGEERQRYSTRFDDLVVSYRLPPGSVVLHECDAEASEPYADPPDYRRGWVICMAFLIVDPRAFSPPSAPSFYLAVLEQPAPKPGPRSFDTFLDERKKEAQQDWPSRAYDLPDKGTAPMTRLEVRTLRKGSRTWVHVSDTVPSSPTLVLFDEYFLPLDDRHFLVYRASYGYEIFDPSRSRAVRAKAGEILDGIAISRANDDAER
jgi:hypothetical protein